MKKQLIILLTVLVSLSACNTDKKPAQNEKQDKTEVKAEDKTEKKSEAIREISWILTELEGKSISSDVEKPIYFMLHTEGNRVSGFAGCNTFSGVYNLEDGNRIRFEKMAMTMMACPDVTFNEAALMEVFELTDNYTLVNGVLSLNVGKRMPLAVFKASK